MPGILRSSRTTFGASCRRLSSASSPLRASVTSKPREMRAVRNTRRAWGSSSTIKTLAAPIYAAPALIADIVTGSEMWKAAPPAGGLVAQISPP